MKNKIFTNDNEGIFFDESFNYVIDNFVIPFADKLDYNNTSKIAERFYPLGKDSIIIIDPQIQFGRPTIKGTRITIDIIQELYNKKEDIKDIAFYYEIDENIIKDVLKFYNVA